MLPRESGMSILGFAHEHDPEMSVVMVTGHPDLSTAVEALKQGAYDYIGKPVTRQALLAVVERACERAALLLDKKRLEAENLDYQRSLEGKVRERTARLRESESRYRDLFQETRRAYDELKSTQEKLIRTERLAAVGELAAQIAHEIRNPLGAISNSVGVLRRDLDLRGDDRRLLDVVHEEAERLEGIVADFLRFARPRPIHRTPQNLAVLLDDLLLLLAQKRPLGRAQGKRKSEIAIEKYYDPELPIAGLDADQTREALWNLLVNAVEAMPGGGVLTVRVQRSKEGDVESCRRHRKGIRPEDRRRFEPFHTTKADGTGPVSPSWRWSRLTRGPSRSRARGEGSSFRLRFPLGSDERQSIPTTR
jgi:signal transduction histidine kinase